MKKSLFALFSTVLIPCFVFSQSVKDSINFKVLLFNQFINGTVLLKNGQSEQVPLNYNTDNQSIVFIKDEQYLAITEPETIDTVYIDDKKFVPVKRAMYEIATPSAQISLFVSYSNKLQPIVATVDHNGNSKQSGAQVSNTVSDTYTGRTFRGNYSIRLIRHFWLKKGYSLYKANNEKQFLRLFPGKESRIQKFISDNQINFDNHLDLIRLVNFCNEPEKNDL